MKVGGKGGFLVRKAINVKRSNIVRAKLDRAS